MSRFNQKGFEVIGVGLIVLVGLLIIGTGYYVWNSQKDNKNSTTLSSYKPQTPSVNNFEECKKAAGSIMQETFPEVCVTVNGKHFTGPSETTAQKYLVIKEWGVKLMINDAVLKQAVYSSPSNSPASSSVQQTLLATKDTLSMDYTCGGNGTDDPVTHMQSSDQDYLLRSKDTSTLVTASNHLESDFTKIGDYYYIYSHNTGHGNCAVTDVALGKVAQTVANAYAKTTVLPE